MINLILSVLDEFNQLCCTDDWPTVRIAFIKMFSLTFLMNQKRESNIDFNTEPSLRSFMNRKLSFLAKYTTMALSNQLEIVLNDLPNEVAGFLMKNVKLDSDKDDVLNFCDSIENQIALVQNQSSTLKNQPLEPEEYTTGTIAQLERSNEINSMSFAEELMELQDNRPKENVAGPSRFVSNDLVLNKSTEIIDSDQSSNSSQISSSSRYSLRSRR